MVLVFGYNETHPKFTPPHGYWLHLVAPSCTQHGGYWACVSYWYRYGSARFSERFLEIASVAELVDAADSKSV